MAVESTGYFADRDYANRLTEIIVDAREALGPEATRAAEVAALQLSLRDAASEIHDYRLAIQQDKTAPTRLTSRETEVLRLIAAGHTDTQIARILFIARGTASRHVSNILAKLDVSSRTAAVDHAYRLGLLERPSPSPADNHHTYM